MRYSSSIKALTKISALVLFLALCPAMDARARDSSDDDVITSFIEGQETNEAAAEYKPERKVVRGDLNGDGRDDLAVLYTLQGYRYESINVQFLAIFFDEGGSLRYVTHEALGGKNRRWLKLESVSEGRVVVKFRQYMPDDPGCCPSKNWRAEFAVIKGKLKEIK